jgi:hypothetical protein
MRHHSFNDSLIDDPSFASVDRFISKNRGNDYNNLQPRIGATWDMRGNGILVMRGGFGMYVTRNRPWFQLTSMDRSTSNAVRIEDPQRLRFFPDVNAVLGGSIEQFLAAGGAKTLFLISDDYVLPYSLNTTFGVGWEINPTTSLTVDFVHDYGAKQIGSADRNLPPSGPIGPSNPRPVPQFTQVIVMENFSKTWYTALETQLRMRLRGTDSLQASYTLSRSYRDGVDFFGTLRGTQRTPDERGYNENDQRHNFTLAAARTLPWRLQVSGIVKAISGSPFGSVQAGFDIDGDASIQNDRPSGLPTRVGRDKVAESLKIINDLRASRGLPPIPEDRLKLNRYLSVDMRLTRALPLVRNQRLELFLEGFNLTNHVNYQPFTVNVNIISPSFLVRNSARDPRQIQWGVRYVF